MKNNEGQKEKAKGVSVKTKRGRSTATTKEDEETIRRLKNEVGSRNEEGRRKHETMTHTRCSTARRRWNGKGGHTYAHKSEHVCALFLTRPCRRFNWHTAQHRNGGRAWAREPTARILLRWAEEGGEDGEDEVGGVDGGCFLENTKIFYKRQRLEKALPLENPEEQKKNEENEEKEEED